MLATLRQWLALELTAIHLAEHRIAIRRVHLTTLLLAATTALAVGFGGGLFTGHYVWRPTPRQIKASCPPGNAQLGCVVKLYAQHAHAPVKDPSGPHFPDVYEGQGHPDWALAKPTISGAIVKAYEYRADGSLAYNAQQLTRLHIRWGAYLFVRGCGYGPAFASTVRPYIAHISVLVLDMEVPAAAGCAPALYASVHAAFPSVRIVIYSAPGTWPGGSSAGLDAWVAAYGPSHPPCLWGVCHVGPAKGQTILAWQLTDGQYGFRIFTPGIGYGDDSLDYGMFAAAKPAAPQLACFGPRWNRRSSVCARVRPQVAKLSRARDASKRALAGVERGLKANRCRVPWRRDICVDLGREIAPSLRQHARYFDRKARMLVKAYE